MVKVLSVCKEYKARPNTHFAKWLCQCETIELQLLSESTANMRSIIIDVDKD